MNGEIRLIPYVTNEQIMDVNELPEGIKVIKAPEMWAKGVKGKNIKVAVLDTGCDTSHPDLKNQIIGGKNFTDDDGGKEDAISDYNGHGTHVAGTIAANDSNGGIAGVAPEASQLEACFPE